MLDLNKYAANNDKASIIHTNGAARLARGARIGAGSDQTFSQRQALEQRDSRLVGSYRRSKTGSAFADVRAQTATPATLRVQTRDRSKRSPGASPVSGSPLTPGQSPSYQRPSGSSTPPPPSFRGRSYDPYA